MNITQTAIPSVTIIHPNVFSDKRGFFFESFRVNSFIASGIECRFVQDNHSGSYKHVLRGLHYQLRQPQGKLVRAVTGTIFDVAVDLRRRSATFGHWAGEILSSENKKMLWIPPGFAHGLFVLSDWADVLYKATEYYAPEFDRTIIWNDERIEIPWPIPPGVSPIVSVKDASGAHLEEAEVYD